MLVPLAAHLVAALCRYTSMLNYVSYYPAETGRAMLKSGQSVTIEFPDLHYNYATVLKYLEE
jgi:hypothetical protein